MGRKGKKQKETQNWEKEGKKRKNLKNVGKNGKKKQRKKNLSKILTKCRIILDLIAGRFYVIKLERVDKIKSLK